LNTELLSGKETMTQTLTPPAKGTTSSLEFKVRNLSEAEWGRKEIMLAEQEMPGLMAVREEYAKQQPLKGCGSWAACT
jgi:hypothetical protein